MMNEKVIITANKKGELISRSPRNPNWGWIRVTQKRYIFDENTGIIKTRFCSALVQGQLNDLQKLGWKEGMELEGKIAFKDSLAPLREHNPEKDYKVAGQTGIICTVDDRPIY